MCFFIAEWFLCGHWHFHFDPPNAFLRATAQNGNFIPGETWVPPACMLSPEGHNNPLSNRIGPVVYTPGPCWRPECIETTRSYEHELVFDSPYDAGDWAELHKFHSIVETYWKETDLAVRLMRLVPEHVAQVQHPTLRTFFDEHEQSWELKVRNFMFEVEMAADYCGRMHIFLKHQAPRCFFRDVVKLMTLCLSEARRKLLLLTDLSTLVTWQELDHARINAIGDQFPCESRAEESQDISAGSASMSTAQDPTYHLDSSGSRYDDDQDPQDPLNQPEYTEEDRMERWLDQQLYEAMAVE
ncbi:hypothetical protein K432DRAFT_393451 [Lepidopterella palustris CBS 459.81]|uniref:Uncharacterized protein n=1 Tax=Lepidopterella palustris CBS 459.81 TaxID=1314670 RepID=A0A8E2JEV4_9PEZI|nr:hypothetical protein K432DRAFT_393451 [Lepidopterella palustris CBS 459.81]